MFCTEERWLGQALANWLTTTDPDRRTVEDRGGTEERLMKSEPLARDISVAQLSRLVRCCYELEDAVELCLQMHLQL